MRVIIKDKCFDLDETNLRFAEKSDVKSTLELTAHLRSLNRGGNDGYSQDKELRDLGCVPKSIRWSKWWLDRFPVGLPPKEISSRLERFFRENPKLANVDKQ